MSNSQNLYKLIDNLKNKIKNLDKIKSFDKFKTFDKSGLNKNICVTNSVINSYRIFNPKNNTTNKKYMALLFDDNFNDFESDSSNNNKNLMSFIKLSSGNIIINYSIIIEISSKPKQNTYCSLALGIKSIYDGKIKIIKGSKYVFDSSLDTIEDKIQINNTLLYVCSEDEELCIISEFYNTCSVNYKKSLIKTLNL